MKDIIEILERWTRQEVAVALGSVVERVGSAPRDPGASLAVASSGEVAGGVTGGCVEPEVIRLGREVLEGAPGSLYSFGLDDEGGFEGGLTCGGRIAVAVYRLDPALVAPVAEALRRDRPIAVTVSLDASRFGAQAIVAPGEAGGADAELEAAASTLLDLGESGVVETAASGKVFVESYAPRPALYLFGASDHVAALVPVARAIGYRVTVCDPRRVFLTRERFPDADALVPEWPDEFLAHAPIDGRTAICMMTHELKFDVPGLKAALSSKAGFVGAMGSAKTRAERSTRLRAEGIGEEALARLHAPVGLPIGARSPEEVAVSIAAELIASGMRTRRERVAPLVGSSVLA